MTRFYLDCEFIEDGHTIDLLSLGVVSEDGEAFYTENGEADLSKASPWVQENVLPHLHHRGIRRWRIAHELEAFIERCGGQPEFWSWCAAYDWVAICQLYGTMLDKPAGWPSYCRDLQQELDRYGLRDDEVPAHPGTAHDALADARWHKAIHTWLLDVVCPEAEGR